MFEFVIEPFNGKGKCSFDFRYNQRNYLNDLKAHLQVFTLLKNASHSLVLEISDEANKLPPIPLKISVNDEIDDCSDIYKIADMASSICRRFSISESDVLVTIGELIWESHSIKGFHQILHADPKTVHVDFPADAKGHQQGARLACTSSVMAGIGSHTIGCFWAIVGSLYSVNENQYRLVANEIIVGNELVAIDDKVIEQSAINEKFDQFEQELQKIGLATIRI
jgi:hypothetical protein